MPQRIYTRSRPVRFGVALTLVAAATLARLAFDPILGNQTPFAFHYIAVVLAAWFVGFDAGVLAALASFLTVDFLFMRPRYSLALGMPSNVAGMTVTTTIAILLAWLTSRWSIVERELVASHEKLQTSERTFKALMDASNESIWLVDRERVLVANATAAGRLAMSVDELRGAKWRTLFPPAVAQLRGEKVEQVFATGAPVHFEDERRGIRFEHTFYPACGPEGEVIAVAAFSRDVTEQRRAEAELRDISQRLAYHVENSPLAVIEFGPDMRLTRWTGGAERVFGWTAAEVLGKRLDEFRWVHVDDAQHVAQVSSELETGADVQRFSANRNYRKDGSVVHCEWYNSSLLDATGKLRSVLSLVLDVTERTRLEQELRAQAQQLATANRIKDDFLATLSHELRTPLNAILGWSQILTGARTSDDRLRRGLETIIRNARLQAQMIEDLLDVSRIVTGSVRLAIQPFDVRAVAEQALDSIRPGADAKQLTVTADIEPGLTLTADPVRVQQVLWNLLSNAVKFTPAGGSIQLTAKRQPKAIELRVTDTGVGIPHDFVPHVFERFRQADSSPTREHGGLGLGLAIVRHIVELHGGTVSARSEGPGRGAVFTVKLPATSAEPSIQSGQPQRRTASADGSRALDEVRILVVDDEPDARDMVSTMLDAAGAIVQAAPSATDALRVLTSFCPDVLISDIAMPDLDGYAFMRRLRGSESAHTHVSSIALTAYAGASARENALAAGFDEYLAKPVIADQLIAAVSRLAARAPREFRDEDRV